MTHWILSIGAIMLAGCLIWLRISRVSMDSHEGKVLLLVVAGVLPAAWLLGTLDFANQTMQSVDFCRQCHVMEQYAESLQVDDDEPLSADHYQNNRIPRETACYECHTSYSAFGGINAKLRGLRHVYAQFVGSIPEKLELYSPYSNSDCLRCHEGGRKYERHKKHRRPKGQLQKISSGEVSCLECHDVAHYFGDDEDE